jgi:hypothetical protein
MFIYHRVLLVWDEKIKLSMLVKNYSNRFDRVISIKTKKQLYSNSNSFIVVYLSHIQIDLILCLSAWHGREKSMTTVQLNMRN